MTNEQFKEACQHMFPDPKAPKPKMKVLTTNLLNRPLPEIESILKEAGFRYTVIGIDAPTSNYDQDRLKISIDQDNNVVKVNVG